MLLEANQQVVYISRTVDKSSWFFDVKPRGEQIDLKVYPEAPGPLSIQSLLRSDTYYTCGPADDFRS
jgi:hypothetical protein